MIKLYANALRNTFSDPVNLEKLGKSLETKCPLFGIPLCNAKHILVGCKRALEERRFT